MIAIRKFSSLAASNHLLQGGVICGASGTDMLVGLVGLTLSFSNPVGTCTFTQPAGVTPGVLRFADFKLQLSQAAGLSAVTVVLIDGRIGFRHATAGQSILLAAVDEPSRLILGIANGVAISGQCFGSPVGSTPRCLGTIVEMGRIYASLEFANSDSIARSIAIGGDYAVSFSGEYALSNQP